MNKNAEEEFFLKSINVERIFDIIERTDYFFLYHIRECEKASEINGGVYLFTLAIEMNLPITDVSKAIKKLEDKGYVIWKLDEKKEKTYIKFTNKAIELMQEQKEKMEAAYEKIISNIPQEDIFITLNTLKKVRDLLGQKNE